MKLNINNNLRKAIGYTRVSTLRQENNGISLEVQTNIIENYIKKYNSDNPESPLNLVGILSDSKSAYKTSNNLSSTIMHTDRPGFQELLNRIYSEKITDIVLYGRDRLSRNFNEYLAFRAVFYSHNISVHYASSNDIVDSDISALDDFFESMLANIAMLNAKNIAYHCKNSLLQVVRDGYFAGGKPAFGYTIEKDLRNKSYLSINKEESFIVQKIFSLYSIGYSYRDILTELKTTPHNIALKLNSPNVIEQIINNEIYMGTYTWNKTNKFKIEYNNDIVRAPSIHGSLQIITPKQFNYVHNLKDTINSKPLRFFSSPFLLNGLITCGNCGHLLMGKNNGKGKSSIYYCKCNTSRWTLSINKDKLENLVLSTLSNKFNDFTNNNMFITTQYNEFCNKFSESKEAIKSSLKSTQENLIDTIDLINKCNNMLNNKDILISKNDTFYSPKFFDLVQNELTIQRLEKSCLETNIEKLTKYINITLPTFSQFKDLFTEFLDTLCILNKPSSTDKHSCRLRRILLTQILNKVVLHSDNNTNTVDISINLNMPNLKESWSLNL